MHCFPKADKVPTMTNTSFDYEQEKTLLQALDEAIKVAGKKMDLDDIADDAPDDEQDSIYEERFHCGTCIVRSVLDTIWVDMERLMDFYRDSTPPENIL